MIGNVWEWTADWFAAHAEQRSCCATARRGASVDPGGAGTGDPEEGRQGWVLPVRPTY